MHNNKPLTIGIVACSAEGAALCYRTICSSASEIMGKHAHPNIVLHSVSLADYVEALDAGDHQAVADIMLHSANQLALAGADFFWFVRTIQFILQWVLCAQVHHYLGCILRKSLPMKRCAKGIKSPVFWERNGLLKVKYILKR